MATNENTEITLSAEQLAEINSKQLQQISKNALTAAVTTVVNSAILVFVLWSVQDHNDLLLWFSAACVVSAVRIVTLFRYRASKKRKFLFWKRAFVVGALLGGLIWGLVGSWLFPQNSHLHQAFVVVVLAGMSAGGVIAYSALKSAATLFLIPALVPVILMLIIQGTLVHFAMSAMILLFLGLLVVLSRRLNQIIFNSLQLRFEKERLNRQMLQSEKLASLGTLSAGVAHELKNPLSAVLGFSELILMKPDNVVNVKKLTERTIKAVHRMTTIIDHMKEFTRDSSSEKFVPLSFNVPIKDSLLLVENQLRNANIDIQLELDDDIPLILGDPSQLESVFQNLLINSRDAFEDLEGDRKKIILFKTSLVGNQVQVLYHDNAGGMDTSVVKNLFTPFFTTKEVGKGTGLGMSIAHGIIKKHGGDIAVESELGEQTTFTMTFAVNPRDKSEKSK